MTGLGILIPGSGPGTGPIVPTPLFTPGVAGYTHRWAPARLAGADGDAVTTLPDYGSTPAALNRSAGTSSLLKKDLAFQYVRANNTILSGPNVANGSAFTFAVLARSALKGYGYAGFGGVAAQSAGDGSMQLNPFGAGGSGGMFGAPTDLTQWRLWVGTYTPGGTTFLRRTSTAQSSGTIVPGAIVAAQFGTTNSVGDIDIAELILWEGLAASDAQRSAIYAAFQAAYPTAALT